MDALAPEVCHRSPATAPEGRAPYLHLLYWLAQSDAGARSMDDVLKTIGPQGECIASSRERLFEEFLKDNTDLSDLIHYDPFKHRF
ncbi:hypothetical protein KF913_00040 [Candidatus Obscuribacterales bacterium]|nr:hypothetical protein [Candidatus Obscuribacterales bacterium]